VIIYKKANFKQELYKSLKERLLNLDDNVNVQPKKQTIGIRVGNHIFCDIVVQSKALKIYVNLKSRDVQDSKKLARDVSNVGHWGNGSYEIKMSDTEELEYILSLLRQSLKKNKQ
jgi:predicted transport protein